MRKHILALISLHLPVLIFGQVEVVILEDTLTEVVIAPEEVSSKEALSLQSAHQTTEEFLQAQPYLTLVHRGGHAPEIIYRGLNSNQVSTLIDGMRIYGACTDRMDPVTSYVTRQNLSSLEAGLGNQNTIHNLGLSFLEGHFKPERDMGGYVQTALSDNNLERLVSTGLHWDDQKFWIRSNLTFHEADNYIDGSGKEQRYTQYSKVNGFFRAGYRLSEHQDLGATILIDRARDVGYAALPMDVSQADAVMIRLEHKTHFDRSVMRNQVYFNDIIHIMDDTKRDSVAMHMDMPGWSTTYGWSGNWKTWRQDWLFGIDYEAVQNIRRADMTMYLPGFADMYMQTWPETRRRIYSLAPHLSYSILPHLVLMGQVNVSYTNDHLLEEFGIQQMKVLDYDASEPRHDLSYNATLTLEYHTKDFQSNTKLSKGMRMPELSERFGFYLFNSQDGFDYVGDPNLLQEQFNMLEQHFSWHLPGVAIDWETYAYFFQDYIFGMVVEDAYQMTIGANGLKAYQNVGDAFMIGTDASISLFLKSRFPSRLTLNYRYGEIVDVGYMPMMSPLEYGYHQNFLYKWLRLQASVRYAHAYERNSTAAGEQTVEAYWLADLAAHARFGENDRWEVSLGVENLFDQLHTTHFSWNRLPQMGRRSWGSVTVNF